MKQSQFDNRKIWIAVFALQVILLTVLTIVAVDKGDSLHPSSIVLVAMDIICSIVSLLIFLSIMRVPRIKRVGVVLLSLLFVDTIYNFSEIFYRLIENDPAMRTGNILVNYVYLICPTLMLVIYWSFLDEWKGKRFPHYKLMRNAMMIISLAYILIVICNSIGRYLFYITEEGIYTRGDLYVITWIMPILLVLICVFRTVYDRMPVGERISLLAYPVLPLLTAVFQLFFPRIHLMTVMTSISIAFLYTNFYTKKELEVETLETELILSRLRMTQMQIKPHLLYNTLTTMAGLCDVDPKKTQDMIYSLADYMRDGFTDIEKPTMHPLRDELEQLDRYLFIEKMRFPNIDIEKDIQVDDFQIPRMSLQPLVENAINHGIRKRRDSKGTILISSMETEEFWIVRIIDDGVGFDGSLIEDMDGHYGLSNVRSRLRILCGGKLYITGRPDEGATVEIRIPKAYRGGYIRPSK